MKELRIKCYQKGFELDRVIHLPDYPSKEDIVEIDEREYEVQYRSFDPGIAGKTYPSITVIVEIQ